MVTLFFLYLGICVCCIHAYVNCDTICDLAFSSNEWSHGVIPKYLNSDQIKIKIKLRLYSVRMDGILNQLHFIYQSECRAVNGPGLLAYDVACNVRNIQTAVHWLGQPAIIYWGLVLTKGWRCLPSYLPLRISCCLMFFMKWIFLKLFGRGEPDRVRHLKCKTNTSVPPKIRGNVSAGYIAYTELNVSVIVAGNVNKFGTSVQFTTCVEEHSPRCPLASRAKSAERWVFVWGDRQRGSLTLGDMKKHQRSKHTTNCPSARQLL